MGKKKKAAPKKEKTARVKKAFKPKKLYTVQGSKLIRERVECSRCGPGYYMAVHYNRRTCGNCYFSQFTDKDGNIRGAGPGGPAGRTVMRQSRRVGRGREEQSGSSN